MLFSLQEAPHVSLSFFVLAIHSIGELQLVSDNNVYFWYLFHFLKFIFYVCLPLCTSNCVGFRVSIRLKRKKKSVMASEPVANALGVFLLLTLTKVYCQILPYLSTSLIDLLLHRQAQCRVVSLDALPTVYTQPERYLQNFKQHPLGSSTTPQILLIPSVSGDRLSITLTIGVWRLYKAVQRLLRPNFEGLFPRSDIRTQLLHHQSIQRSQDFHT